MTKYKEVAKELEGQVVSLRSEIDALKAELAMHESDFADSVGSSLPSEEAREILRLFASKASNRHEVVLLVRALSKLPA